MMLPIHIAKKLADLQTGKKLPASGLRHEVISSLLAEGILVTHAIGRSKSLVSLSSADGLNHYLNNKFGIADLQIYISTLLAQGSARADAVLASANSKIKPVRTFTGFMVSTLQTVTVFVNQQPFILQPHRGIHFFVSDYKAFVVPTRLTIVGVENAENFLSLQQQTYLFKHITPLFVCRYPYSHDLLKWLVQIPNSYLHFGDIDFSGISIFLHEYKNALKERADFFVPPNLNELLKQYGNRELYNRQRHISVAIDHPAYNELSPVISLLHHHKKGLEQEALILR